MESWVSKNGKHVGRVDIYNAKGEAWEVKSENIIGLALEQLDKYIGGALSGENYSIEKPGPAGAFEGSFAILYGDLTFVVKYDTPSPGAISYSVHPLKQEETCPVDQFVYVRTKKPASTAAYNAGVVAIPIFIPVPMSVPFGGGQPQYSSNGSGGGWFLGFSRFCSSYN